MANVPGESRALYRHARELASAGRAREAEQVLERLVASEPSHVGALGFLGLCAYERGDYPRSEAWLRRALEIRPDDALLRQNLGLVAAARGHREAAIGELDAAIAADFRLPMAHLHRGALLADGGRDADAADALARAVALNPNLARPDAVREAPPRVAELLASLEAARRRLANRERRRAIDALAQRFGDPALERARAFVAVFNGERDSEWAHPLQTPSWMYFPGLEPRPWFERDEFDWVAGLEASAPAIRAELEGVLAADAGIRPYVPERAGASEDWRPLAGNTNWGAYHLYRGGVRQGEHCAACPETAAALERLPLMDCPGHAPEAFFSILRPGMHIPPHVGLANTKLAVHLALVIPGSCSITVGGETREWTEGEALVFDDSFEHEARNGSDSPRAVLITEIWNPQFTEAEREAVRAVVGVGERLHAHWESVAAEIRERIESSEPQTP